MLRLRKFGWKPVDVIDAFSYRRMYPAYVVCVCKNEETGETLYVVCDEDKNFVDATTDKENAIQMAKNYANRHARHTGGML